jgi:hypothetical protein
MQETTSTTNSLHYQPTLINLLSILKSILHFHLAGVLQDTIVSRLLLLVFKIDSQHDMPRLKTNVEDFKDFVFGSPHRKILPCTIQTPDATIVQQSYPHTHDKLHQYACCSSRTHGHHLASMSLGKQRRWGMPPARIDVVMH